MESGNLPPSFWYSSRTLRKMRARISWSSLASPGGGSAVLLGKASAGKAVDLSLDLGLVFRGRARSLPESAGLVRIDFPNHQPVRLLQCIDVLLGVRTDHDAIHPERQQALHFAAEHAVPLVCPGVVAVNLGQVVEGPVILFLGG